MISSTINKANTGLTSDKEQTNAKWFGSSDALHFDQAGIKAAFEQTNQTCYIVRDESGRVGVATKIGTENPADLQRMELLATIPAYQPEQLGDPTFRQDYGLKYNYMAGAMANGIASAELVIAMGKAGILASFGAGGMVISKVAQSIDKIQAALPNGPYAVNLIHSPNEEALEREATELFLQKGVKVIEASAFMGLTNNVIHFRASGLSRNADGSIHKEHKIIAKLSRLEVADKFMRPAPENMLQQLVSEGKITAEQAELAKQVPVADDIVIEADSGGHTDNRSMVCLLPSILNLRNKIQAEFNYPKPLRVGAGGGISTPESVLAAFNMGAAFVVTGSINQACRESGSSDHVRKVLAQASMTDIMMAPAADMFELGVKLQVLKKGTLFALRAQKLYELYITYESLEAIPDAERIKIEKTVFKDTFENIWQSCISFFEERDPEQITRAQGNPKRKMALVFRWYLGLSSAWANAGVKGREMDYQIWCGPAMGAFNEWVKGSKLESWENRYVADVAEHLLKGAAYVQRLNMLEMLGVRVDGEYRQVAI